MGRGPSSISLIPLLTRRASHADGLPATDRWLQTIWMIPAAAEALSSSASRSSSGLPRSRPRRAQRVLPAEHTIDTGGEVSEIGLVASGDFRRHIPAVANVNERPMHLDPVDVAPLVELTVANELDVVLFAESLPHGYAGSLLALLSRARGLMSSAAWTNVQRIL